MNKNKTQSSYFYLQHSKLLFNVKNKYMDISNVLLGCSLKNTYAQVFGDFTITEIDMIERKTKEKIYDFSLYNGVSSQTYNFFSKPTFFFVSVSFSFFCHC